MHVLSNRREGVVLGFFWVVVVAVTGMTGYRLVTGGESSRQVHAREEAARALENKLARLEAAVQAEPGNLRNLVALGDAYLDARQTRQALAVFQRAETVAPDDPHVLSDLGTLYQGLGRYDDAIAKFTRVIQVAPDRLGARYHLGMIYQYNKGDSATALAILRDLLDRNPDPRLAELVRAEIAKIEGAHGEE